MYVTEFVATCLQEVRLGVPDAAAAAAGSGTNSLHIDCAVVYTVYIFGVMNLIAHVLPLPPGSVGEGVMFLGCPVCPSVRLVIRMVDVVICYYDVSRMTRAILTELAGSIHQPLLMT